MPRTGLSKDRLVEEIIKLAETEIRSAGFKNLKLTQLARELGVSHAALYKHIPSKAALLDVISEKWLLEMDACLRQVSLAATEDPRALLLEWFITYHRLKRDKIRKDPEIYKAFNMAVEGEKEFVQTHLNALNDQLSGIIEKGKQCGIFCRFSTAVTVELLMNSTISFHHPTLVVEHQGEDRVGELKRLIDTIIIGLNMKKHP